MRKTFLTCTKILIALFFFISCSRFEYEGKLIFSKWQKDESGLQRTYFYELASSSNEIIEYLYPGLDSSFIEGNIYSYSKSKKYAVMGNNYIYNLETGEKIILPLPGVKNPPDWYLYNLNGITFSPDERHIAYSYNEPSMIAVFNLESKKAWRLHSGDSEIYSLERVYEGVGCPKWLNNTTVLFTYRSGLPWFFTEDDDSDPKFTNRVKVMGIGGSVLMDRKTPLKTGYNMNGNKVYEILQGTTKGWLDKSLLAKGKYKLNEMTESDKFYQFAIISPDSRLLVYANDNQLTICNTDTGDTKPIGPETPGGAYSDVIWSPDLSMMACTYFSEKKNEISVCIIPVSTLEIHKIIGFGFDYDIPVLFDWQ